MQRPPHRLPNMGFLISLQCLIFEQNTSAVPQNMGQMTQNPAIINKSRPEIVREDIKILDKPQRKVMEIRVFYDDQTWDTFLPVKK